MSPDYLDDLLAFFAVVGASFCFGVGVAFWRAVGWAERIRSWAESCATGSESVATISTAQLDGKGDN